MITMQQGFSKFYISALCLLLLCCTSCHRRNNPPPVLPVVEVPDEDSVFVVNEILKKEVYTGEYRVHHLQETLQHDTLRFEAFKGIRPITTARGLEITPVFIPPMGTDIGPEGKIYLLLKRKNMKALLPPATWSPDSLISTGGLKLHEDIAAICADDNDLCTMLLLQTHFPLRISDGWGGSSKAPYLGYYLNLKDIHKIKDTASFTRIYAFVE
jgi:hypothetical protein